MSEAVPPPSTTCRPPLIAQPAFALLPVIVLLVRVAGIPKPIHLFQRDGRVVFAYGDEAAADGVDAGDKLGDDPDFTATRESLGDYDVSFYVLTEPILDLVDSTDAGTDADWQKAKAYLEPLSALVAGTSGDGDDLKSAFKLVVK